MNRRGPVGRLQRRSDGGHVGRLATEEKDECHVGRLHVRPDEVLLVGYRGGAKGVLLVDYRGGATGVLLVGYM